MLINAIMPPEKLEDLMDLAMNRVCFRKQLWRKNAGKYTQTTVFR
jgi:hypothetical protein